MLGNEGQSSEKSVRLESGQPGDNSEKQMGISSQLEGGDLPSKSLRFLFRNGEGDTNRGSHD